MRKTAKQEREERRARLDVILERIHWAEEQRREKRRKRRRHEPPVAPPPKDRLEALAEDLGGTLRRYPGVVEIVASRSPEAVDLVWDATRIEMVGIPAMRVHVTGRKPTAAKRPYRSSRFGGAGSFDASTAWHDPFWGAISAGNEVLDSMELHGITVESVTIELRFTV